MYNIRNLLPDYIKKDFYFAFIHSHIMSTLPFIISSNKREKMSLERAFKKCVRILFNIPRQIGAYAILEKFNIKPFDQILCNFYFAFMKQIHQNEQPQNICCKFIKASSSRTQKLIVPASRFTKHNLKLALILE